jgi:Family of unknown function (DUF6444)
VTAGLYQRRSWLVSGLEELSREELIALAQRLVEANAVLEERVGQLQERVRQLERQVSRNSGNSSMPPCTVPKLVTSVVTWCFVASP